MLEEPIPERWGFFQRIKNTFIYVVARVTFWWMQLIPYALVIPFARPLGWLAALVAGSERRRAEKHLAMAMPEADPAEHRRIARAMFVHFARCLVEATHLTKFITGPHAIRLSEEHRALYDEALAEGKGLIVVTGHIGNWEMLAQVVVEAGYPATTIAKPTYDPRLTRWVHRLRSQNGLRIIWRGESGGSREMIRVFKEKGILALLIDQDTKVQGDWVPFFGRPAFTPTAAGSLAIRMGAPVLVGWVQRRGTEHVVHFERVERPDSGDAEKDALELTARITARLEHAIRQAPEQWVWMHRRWKT